MRRFFSQIYRLLCSLKLACVLLGLLLLLTWLGTVYQAEAGLYAAIARYFDSWYVLQEVASIGDVKLVLPLPGAWPVMILLFLNMLFGGVLRVRPRWSRLGVIVAHISILVILAAGFVTSISSKRGYVALFEGESQNFKESYDEDVLQVVELDAKGRPQGKVFEFGPQCWIDAPAGSQMQLEIPELGLQLDIFGFVRHGVVLSTKQRAADAGNALERVVDGHFIRRLELEKEAERNSPVAYAKARLGEQESGAFIVADKRQAKAAYRLDLGGRSFALQFARKRALLPFNIKVDDFRVEFYPASRKPKSFESDVSVQDGNGAISRHTIKMNEPLRRDGLVFYQANWGPQDQPNPSRYFSQLEVVENRAEKWPEYGLYLAAFGLCYHFIWKLSAWIYRREKKAKTPNP